MANLTINLFGPPTITFKQAPLAAETYKATALLAYLAVNQGAHTRQELATLLWSELDKEKALAALRTTLWKLKRVGLDEWLQIERNSVFLNFDQEVEVDILSFQGMIAQCETHGHHPSKVCPACLPPLAEAVNLYRGDFMKGFSLRDASEFDNWQSLNDEILRQEVRLAFEKLVRGHRAQGEIAQAVHFARRWLNHDRINEEVHRQLMILQVSAGQRNEAIQQYRELTKLLHREGVEPQLETTQLYHRILNERTERIISAHELESPIILATDIENADEMWANFHEQMAHTVSRYQNIVKESASQYGGHVLKQADNTSIVFFDRGQPLHCVLAIHKRLMRTTWTINTLPRIRIALNAVERRQQNIEEYAADIHRSQRLLSAGWGGQVLLTTKVHSTVELPPNARVQDLGIHALKDLSEPLRIYSLSHPDLPSREFPPLQSLAGYRHNLPSYPTVFIDREKEQVDLTTLLLSRNCCLLTLTGPGGVGKTRLALQVAAQQISNFPDGVYFVPVIVPKTPDLIPSVLAETFKFTFYEQKDPLDLISDFLREKDLLLIIDNFEHLIEGAEMLASLLRSAPGLKMIVTSRECLNLSQEWIYEVHGMSFPANAESPGAVEEYSAVQLFIQNARRLLTGFNPTPEDLTAIAEICQLVNGIPLAIELATAWVRTLSCREIANEIRKNVDFLSTNIRDIPVRHRSLRAVFEHSWSLLSEEDRRIFRKLSVFRGGFTTDAVYHVTNATPILLASFVDRSLLMRTSHDRFEVMETIRHYAAQKLLESGADHEKTNSLHHTYYIELLERNFRQLLGGDQKSSVEEISTDFENIRAAWIWAVDTQNWTEMERYVNGMLSYLEVSGKYANGYDMFSLALEKLSANPRPELARLRATIKLGVGWVQFCIGNHIIGLQKMNEALDAFIESGSSLEMGAAYYYLAQANERLNLPQLAVEQARRSLQLFREQVHADERLIQTVVTQALAVYGSVLFKLGHLKEAKKVLQESLSMNQQLRQPYGSVHALDALAKVSLAEGDLSVTTTFRLQALKIAREFGNKYSIAMLLNNLGDVYAKLNDIDQAIRFQQESIEISREIGYRWLTAIGYNNMAFIYLRYRADPNEAIRLYRESLSLFSDIQDQRGMIYTLHDLGLANLEARQLGQSRRHFLEALDQAHQVRAIDLQLYILSSLAGVYPRLGQPAFAHELCHLILTHPESSTEAKQRANDLLNEITQDSATPQPSVSTSGDQPPELEQVVDDLLAQAQFPHTFDRSS